MIAGDGSAMMTESKPTHQKRHTMTSFSVTDILGYTESRPRSRDRRLTPSDVTAWQQPADPEITSTPLPTHRPTAVANKVYTGTGNLRWLQVLQQHPTCE